MKRTKIAAMALAILLVALGESLADQQQETRMAKADEKKVGARELEPVDAAPPEPAVLAPPPPVLYKPPKLGRPVHTVGGGSRGTSDRVPVVFTLTPNHVGQTVSAQPSLFWYVDRAPDESTRIEFTLLDEDSVEPRVEKALATPDRAGVYRIRLTDYAVELAPGVEYEWSVTLILDPEKRSKDIMATGFIARVESSGQLEHRLVNADRAWAAAVYADEGLWYDSFAALSDEIERNPEDAALSRQRLDVLRQVGLDRPAAGLGG